MRPPSLQDAHEEHPYTTDNRCTVRLGELPTLRDKLIGFRVAIVPE